jgi:hypothetical protein
MPARRYPASRYDDQLNLRTPLPLWLAMAFLVRHLALLGITFLPTTGEEIEVLRDLVQPWYLLADMPALPVLFVAMRRRPQCGDWARRTWRSGRWLLMASAAGYLVLLGPTLAASARPLHLVLNEWVLASVVANLWILIYLVRSPLLRDLFADFPERRSQGATDPRRPTPPSGGSVARD